jgi:hypothetical protein
MSETGDKDVEDLKQLIMGELCGLLQEIIRELRRRASISPTIRRRASTGLRRLGSRAAGASAAGRRAR